MTDSKRPRGTWVPDPIGYRRQFGRKDPYRKREHPLCPRCEDHPPMARMTVETITLDRCASCGGTWFDAGELRDVLFQRTDLGGQVQDRPRESPLACPSCVPDIDGDGAVDGVTGMLCAIYPGTRVEIDLCLLCRGVWLDKGEFEALHEHRKKALASGDATVQPYTVDDKGLERTDGKDYAEEERKAAVARGEAPQTAGGGVLGWVGWVMDKLILAGPG